MFVKAELFSLVGGGILCVNMWPQIFKIWKTSSAKDLSYVFIFLNAFGLSMMDIYGILKDDYSLYVPMSISLINTLILLGFKYKNDYIDIISVSKVDVV